jgi:lipopolysaccharide export system protein LptC
LQILRKHKRNRAITALLFPAVIFLFLIGWSLYWIGLQKRRQKAQPVRPKDNVSIMAIVLEEPPEIVS